MASVVEQNLRTLLKRRCGRFGEEVLPLYLRLLRTVDAMKPPRVTWAAVAEASGRTPQYLSMIRRGKKALILRDFLHQALLFGHDAGTLARVLAEGADPWTGAATLALVEATTVRREYERWITGIRRFCHEHGVVITNAPQALGWAEDAPSEALFRWWGRETSNPDLPRILQLLLWQGESGLDGLMHFVYPLPVPQTGAARAS
jgi:hypothetical protein